MTIVQAVKLVATAKLLPDTTQAAALRDTMERFNTACEWLAGEAFAQRMAGKYYLHHAFYRLLRDRFGLSAQMAVRCIGKVSDAYKRDKTKRPHFRLRGAVPYDQRIYSFKGLDRVSILTLAGRILVAFVAGDYHAARLGEGIKRGQADLVLRRGRWYLYVTVEVPDGAPLAPQDFLGVDLGIRNLATDSDGERHTGDAVESLRVALQKRRGDLQRVGTRSAHRALQRLGGREATFRKITNHTISKALVRKARDTGRGLALEDLSGIRDRITVTKGQRAKLGGWAFFQLRAFVTYKAQIAGVPLVIVDPRNTSRTCLACGHCAAGNRRSQAEFVCQSCDFTEHADVVGARNIARKGHVDWPMVRDVDAGIPRHHRRPR